MDSQEKYEYWLELAEYDIETAKAMSQTGRYLYVGFMCQLVVEKSLKAVIAKTGAFPPKIHDLLRLTELANLLDFLNEEQKQLLHDLTPLSIEARYVSYKEAVARGLTKRVCEEYIEQAEAMLKWIREKLRQ